MRALHLLLGVFILVGQYIACGGSGGFYGAIGADWGVVGSVVWRGVGSGSEYGGSGPSMGVVVWVWGVVV